MGRASCVLSSLLRGWAGATPRTAWSTRTCPGLNLGDSTAWLTSTWSPAATCWRFQSCVPAPVYEAGSLSGSSDPWLCKGGKGEVGLWDCQTAANTPPCLTGATSQGPDTAQRGSPHSSASAASLPSDVRNKCSPNCFFCSLATTLSSVLSPGDCFLPLAS